MEENVLQCLNCGKPVPPEKAKIFAQVFVCPECHVMATSFYQRCERELKQLLTLTHESIREALVKGAFHPVYQEREEIPKAELLRHIIRISEEQDASKSKPKVR